MEEHNQQNQKSFIDSLKEYNESNLKKSIFVPSLGRDMVFSLLSTKQQRYIIESSLDNPIYNAVFHQKVYEIIKELSDEPDVIDSLDIFDKDAILIQLRYHYIDSKYKDKDFTCVIESIKESVRPDTIKTDNVDGFTISFKVPSMKEEYKLYKDFKKSKFYKMTPDGDDEVRGMVAILYILELSKFVSIIAIDSSGATVNFNDISLEKRIDILDNLGKKVASKIHDYINDMKKKHESFYKVDEDTEIEISPELFS